MKKDTAITAIISGGIAGLVYQGFVWLFYIFGVAKINPFQIGAYVMVQPGVDITSIPAQALGFVQHTVHSIFLAAIAIYVLRLIGLDHWFLKGLAFGGLLYFFLYGIASRFVIPPSIYQPDVATSTVFLFGNLIFGLVSVYIINQLSATKS